MFKLKEADMVGTLRKSGLLVLIGSVLFMALAIACTREVEVPGETVVVEKEVIKEVEVMAQPEGYVHRALEPFPKRGGTLRTS